MPKLLSCLAGFILPVFIFALSGCAGHRATKTPPHSSMPAMPAVGYSALVDMDVLKSEPKQGYTAASHHRPVTLRIDCVAASGKSAHFKVYYIYGGKPNRLAYYVLVDYSTNVLEKRTVIKDRAGKLVPRTRRIDGNPVPFRDFLAFDNSYLDSDGRKSQALQNGSEAHIVKKENNESDDYWYFIMTIAEKVPSCYGIQYQYWKSSDWLWSKSSGSGWQARRRLITAVKSK